MGATPIVGAASALGGVLVGAFGEAFRSRLAFRREKASLLQDERKAHLEDVYEVLEGLRDAYSILYADALRAAALGTPGHLSQAMKPVPWARLRMLVFLYLPELQQFLEEVELTGPKFGSAATDVMTAGNPGKNQQLIIRLDQPSRI